VRTALLALVGATAVGLLASPAHAETWHGADARHDVTTFSHSAQPPPCGTSTDGTDPTDRLRDITGLRVAHTTDTITVRVSMRELRRRGSDTNWVVHLRVPAGAFAVDVARGGGHGLTALLTKEPHFPPPDECGGTLVVTTGRGCVGLRVAVDPSRDTLVLTVPRACLKEPRWVQAGAGVYGGFSGTPDDYTSHSDYWAQPGESASGFLPPYGPRVRRG
jgi:hypothetical protein